MNEFSNGGIFTTTNQQLAFALATAGCQFAPQDQNGPAINVYTVDTLRAKKVGLGMPLDEAVKEAVSRKIPGNVGYIFVRDETLARCLKAWDLTVETLREGISLPATEELDEEAIMAVLCVHANNRKQMEELPWFNQPWVHRGTSSTSKNGEKVTTTGTGKIYKLNLSKEKKEELLKK